VTTAAFFRVLGRRWYVMVAGVTLSALVFMSMAGVGDVYSTETNVIFVAPGDQSFGQVRDDNVESLVNFAAAVERVVLAGRPADRLASTDATLFGAGVRQGYEVSLPNSGGQWQNSFNQPILKVEVVGPSASWVSATLGRLLDRIDSVARERQAQSDVAPQNTITTERAPTTASIRDLGSTRSERARGAAALLALGLALSAIAAVLADRAADRRHSRRTTISHAPGLAGQRGGSAA
jgi:hypothetical protein